MSGTRAASGVGSGSPACTANSSSVPGTRQGPTVGLVAEERAHGSDHIDEVDLKDAQAPGSLRLQSSASGFAQIKRAWFAARRSLRMSADALVAATERSSSSAAAAVHRA